MAGDNFLSGLAVPVGKKAVGQGCLVPGASWGLSHSQPLPYYLLAVVRMAEGLSFLRRKKPADACRLGVGSEHWIESQAWFAF